MSGRRHIGKPIEKHKRNVLLDCVCLPFSLVIQKRSRWTYATWLCFGGLVFFVPLLSYRGLWLQMSLFRQPGHERRWSAAGRGEEIQKQSQSGKCNREAPGRFRMVYLAKTEAKQEINYFAWLCFGRFCCLTNGFVCFLDGATAKQKQKTSGACKHWKDILEKGNVSSEGKEGR